MKKHHIMIAAALTLFASGIFSEENSAAFFPEANSLFARDSPGLEFFPPSPFTAFTAEPLALVPEEAFTLKYRPPPLTRWALNYRAQTPFAPTSGSSAEVKTTPPWVKSLRRAEIVALGSLPLTIFWTSTLMDLYRAGTHDWDSRYLPWPAKGPDAVELNNTELAWMFAIAGGTSILIAVVDFFIVQYKRSKPRSNAAVMRTIPKKKPLEPEDSLGPDDE